MKEGKGRKEGGGPWMRVQGKGMGGEGGQILGLEYQDEEMDPS